MNLWSLKSAKFNFHSNLSILLDSEHFYILYKLSYYKVYKWLNGLELSNNNAICINVLELYYFLLERRKVNSRKCEDKKSTKKCKRLKKKKKCKKKRVWKKCLKTCEKCDDSGTQINEHTQLTPRFFLPFFLW